MEMKNMRLISMSTTLSSIRVYPGGLFQFPVVDVLVIPLPALLAVPAVGTEI
jgi:hypothetical protein